MVARLLVFSGYMVDLLCYTLAPRKLDAFNCNIHRMVFVYFYLFLRQIQIV